MQYWITNLGLTPDHDHKIEAEALAEWSGSGWRKRDDQTDPVDDLAPADPREPVDELPAVDTEKKPPAAVVEPVSKTTTTTKGS